VDEVEVAQEIEDKELHDKVGRGKERGREREGEGGRSERGRGGSICLISLK
jgi:hypothetical protein